MNSTMKPIEEVYPDHAKDEKERGGFYGPGDYGPLLESLGHKILLQVDDGDYQGDSRLILKNEGTGDYGLLIFGWGSCSGCDALQACDSMKEIAELRESLANDIKWYASAKALLDYMEAKDWETDYSWHADETKDFVIRSKSLLAQEA